MNPLVSVIIPTYNCGHYIEEALASLLAQKYEQFEALVVDDCSTDGTYKQLDGRLPDQRFRLHQQARNGGASVARNTGVSLTSGEIVVLLDSDDCLLPDHLSTVVAKLREMPDVGLLCCDSRVIGPGGETLHQGRSWHTIQCAIHGRTLSSGRRSLEDIFRFSHCFTGFTIRRKAYEELGGLDQGIFPLDDYDFMLRMAGKGWGVFYLDEVLCLRRDHDTNCSGIRQSVKVGRKKLECLQRALTAHPELRERGRVVPQRFAEVYEELAVSHFYRHEFPAGTLALSRAAALDPARLARMGTLALRRLRRGRSAAAP